jgi:hypothetical protein
MDYMRDKVLDCSLMVRDAAGSAIAVLPGCIEEDGTYLSHGRLTYGGFVTSRSMRLPAMLSVFESCMDWLSAANVRTLIYKTVPHIYHRAPAEEDRYALFLLGATWTRSGMLAVVDRASRIEYQERRRRAVKKARQNGLTVRLSEDYATYWRILTELLRERHGCDPVHSLAEIEHLHRTFPDNIRLYACFEGDAMRAGIVVYLSGRVARCQYIASSAEGRRTGALDLVLDHLISEGCHGAAFIDLGTSDEQHGRILNQGLMEQKEGFGARAVALDQYRIDVSGWRPGSLTSVLR